MTCWTPRRRYDLRITRPAARALAERLPEKVAAAANVFITTTLLHNHYRLGKRLLLPPYEGAYSARRGSYRILYEVDDETNTVTVTAVEHRGEAYRSCSGGRPAPHG